MRLSEIINLMEGLIHSVSRNEIQRLLKKEMPEIRFNTWPDYNPNVIRAVVSKRDYHRFKWMLSKYGWYIASADEHSNDKNMLGVYIEPKYDVSVSVPNKLYHVAPQKNIDKILKVGLVPRAGKRRTNHPARVYLAINKDSAVDISRIFSKGDYFNSGDEKSYSLLEIDTTKLQNVKFYNDMNFDKEGVYTEQNIPPNAISLYLWHI